jgi:hypothetical protein
MAQVLILCRLHNPSSELAIAEVHYERSALEDLLGIPVAKVNDDRLYRALDLLLKHKSELEQHLRRRMGELFEMEYDLLLYDSTSTYFEGLCEGNPQARRGYSRDKRPDCKQITIALVVTRHGLPLTFEVFDGNRQDATTTQEMVRMVEARHGKARRIWVMDRGMVSEANLEFLRQEGRSYITGTPRRELERFKEALTSPQGWVTLAPEVEGKVCPPAPGETETFLLCRSQPRRAKEQAMLEQEEQRFTVGLESLQRCMVRQHLSLAKVHQRLGRLKTLYPHAAALFEIRVTEPGPGSAVPSATLEWNYRSHLRDWSLLRQGCYLLRTNIADWQPYEIWRAYVQLTEAEAAFRIHKSDLRLRPVWHQKEERVQAHILVCFLAYVLWRTFGEMCFQARLGNEPRPILDELSQISMVDVLLPTRSGPVLRRRCVVRPTPAQEFMLQRLKLRLPRSILMR